MENLNDYTLAGYEGRQTGAITSSNCWLAEQAGKICRQNNILPLETSMSKGYSVRVNRVFIIKFNTKTLVFETIAKQGK